MGKMGRITILKHGKSFRKISLNNYRKDNIKNISKI